MKCKFCGNESDRECCSDCQHAYNIAKQFNGDVLYIKRLLKQDRCSYCGLPLEFYQKHIDHIVPVSKGGSNENDNLCLICTKCQKAKGDMTGGEFRALPKVEKRVLKKAKVRSFYITKKVVQTRRKTFDELEAENAFELQTKGIRLRKSKALKEGVSLTVDEEVEIKERVFLRGEDD